MPSYSKILVAFAATLLATANAHMIMGTPTPYGKSTLNNSPLAADGSDFPCKQRSGVYDAEGASNTMPIGVNQTLSFIGSAVHGGGSCQVSLTTDKAPTASSKWQVIFSIMGGCPASAPGNLPENPNGSGASSFQFSVPEGITPGEYTLAWTWFNKVGNREMYMNCAPVTVTGGSGKRDAGPIPTLDAPVAVSKPGFSKRATFPPMFVANVGAVGNSCGTQDSADLLFPDPGQYVQYAGATPGASLVAPVHCSGSEAAASAASAASSPVASTTAASIPPAGAATPTPTAAPTAASIPIPAPPSTSPLAAASPSAVTISGTAVPTASAAPSVVPAPAPAPSPSSGSTPSAGALTGPCTPEGEWNCIGGNSFQQCASGAWTMVRPMAAGTYCTTGMSSNLGISRRARPVRFSGDHLRRRAWA